MSSGSESDEEYVPGEPEQLSEEDSADEETDLQFEQEQDVKTKKRKAATERKGKKRQRTRGAIKEPTPEKEQPEENFEEKVNPELEKKREDDLWAMFLDGTDSKPKITPNANTIAQESATPVVEAKKDLVKQVSKKEDDAKSKETRIFEFAGETIIVEDNVIKEKIKTAEKPVVAAAVGKFGGPSLKSRGSGSGGGLSNILGQLNKTNKLSTLEKSKLDWETYKKEEGVEDEVQSVNKGKQGYLERQDFLQRADMRQYEIERDLRMSRRSNR